VSVSYQELLKPELIKTVSGLQLVSRAIASHYLSGFNKSKRVGNGMEFSQYRNYDKIKENGPKIIVLQIIYLIELIKNWCFLLPICINMMKSYFHL